MKYSWIRVLVAFLVAPMIIPTLLAFLSYLESGAVFTSFFLRVGAIIGYGFAIVFGGPAYLLYINKKIHLSFFTFFWFILVCTLVFFCSWCVILTIQEGGFAVFHPLLWAFSLFFFLASTISVAAFYLIAFAGAK